MSLDIAVCMEDRHTKVVNREHSAIHEFTVIALSSLNKNCKELPPAAFQQLKSKCRAIGKPAECYRRTGS